MKVINGFSIIELIITLVLMGLVSVMITPFFQSGVSQSSTPAFRMQASGDLQLTMENIMTAYQEIWKAKSQPYNIENDDLVTLQGNIASGIYTPTGFSVSVEQNTITKLYNYTAGLDSLTDQNDALIVTLHNDDGGTLTFILTTGENFNLR
jgi:prepilin-type N-terminal cleavage/methylation domain-containing protein